MQNRLFSLLDRKFPDWKTRQKRRKPGVKKFRQWNMSGNKESKKYLSDPIFLMKFCRHCQNELEHET